MIEISAFYFIQEEDVEAIIKKENLSQEFPFSLTIQLRSGREYSVSYQSKTSRDSSARQYAQQVERNVRNRDRTIEEIFNRLYLMDDRLRRVDKRGLRIWQQLKTLLGVEVEEK